MQKIEIWVGKNHDLFPLMKTNVLACEKSADSTTNTYSLPQYEICFSLYLVYYYFTQSLHLFPSFPSLFASDMSPRPLDFCTCS